MNEISRHINDSVGRFFLIIVVFVCLVSLVEFAYIPRAGATPASARNAIKGGWPLYVSGDATGSQCSTTGSVVSTPAESGDEESRKKQIWAYFINEMNLSAPQAAGAMGNLKQENSAFDPTVQQGGGSSAEIVVNGSTGYGIVQWTSRGRQQALKDFAESIGQSSGDLDTQLQFINKEVSEGYRDMLTALTATNDAAEAAKIWHGPTPEAASVIPRSTYDFAGYEASGDGPEGIQERIDSALTILNELGSETGSYTAPTCTPNDGSGTTVAVPTKEGWAWPIAGASRSDIGRDYGVKGCGSTCGTHKAIDLGFPKDTEVLAAHKGVVSKIVNMGSCGYATLIKVSDVDNDLWMEYQHMNPDVAVGKEVLVGEPIGKVGKFCGSGYHLHFGISLSNSTNAYSSPLSNTADPKDYLP